jgi:hypothetical protein
MAFAIPKIEYKNLDTTGTTASGNGTVSSIPVTTAIEIGMVVTGAGIPAGATVGSKTSSSVTLASGALCTANASGVAIAFCFKIEFDYPPKEQKGGKISTNATISESISGVRQVSVNHVLETRDPIFSFISPTLKTSIDTFLQTHACLGSSFRYFEDKTLTPYLSYELDELKVEGRKIASRGVDLYVWEFPLKFRRVL